MEIEIWKSIIGFEGYYEVSNKGNIKSINRVLPDGRKFKGKRLTTCVTNSGYLQVSLYKNCKRTHAYIHRLVAESFITIIGSELCVNHINGCKTDNNISNLEIVTTSMNNHHAKVIGLNKNYGTTSGNSKLSKIEVESIRNLLENNSIKQTEIAERFNVSKSTITDIKKGRIHNIKKQSQYQNKIHNNQYL